MDDVIYLNEPMFQDGLVSQGVNDVVNAGASYVSMAFNAGADNGYLSTFRGVQATVAGTSGRYMNFAPSGTPVTQLPITTNAANTVISMQFDQPFGSQEAANSANHTTSQVNFFVLDSSGNIVATGNSNNIATDTPAQTVTIPNAGSYTVAIQVVSGADPGHVQFIRYGNGPANQLQVSQQFGSAGGTFYPASFGHNTAANAFGGGAVPWWAASPFLSQSPLQSEGFSGAGPALYVRNPDGSLKSGTVTPTLNPSIAGVDGGNTSFFVRRAADRHVQSAVPRPAGDVDQPLAGPPQLLRHLVGRAQRRRRGRAQMKQQSPNLTNEQIRTGLEAGTTPVNGAPPGTWDRQGGYGLVNAVNALAAVNVLKVSTTTPAAGAPLTQTPSQIVVTFNRPVDINTITPADLAFVKVPSTLTNMKIGTPFGVDNARFPTQVAFPFVFTVAPGKLGNGSFTYRIENPASEPVITSEDGKPLAQTFNSSFQLNDTTDPRVINTTLNGRVITVQFSEAMSPASITPSTLFLSPHRLEGQHHQHPEQRPPVQDLG